MRSLPSVRSSASSEARRDFIQQKEEATMKKYVSALAAVGALASIAVPARSAEYMEKSQQMATRAYLPGVITDGGRIVWLAGQTGFRDEQGKEMVGFDAQARQAFRGIDVGSQEGRRQSR